MLAQEEARLLNHDFIGTEHILLGLTGEGRGVAARALASHGMTLEVLREKTGELVGPVLTDPPVSPPFTPRSKSVLELAFRESLRLQHNYIGTEHLLLALINEGEGVGAQVLISLGTDLGVLRDSVIALMSGASPEISVASRPIPAEPRRLLCSLCGRDTWESAHYLSADPVTLCAECIETVHQALNNTAADVQRIALPPRVFGTPPTEDSVESIASLVSTAFVWDSDPEQLRQQIEDFDELYPFLTLAQARPGLHIIGADVQAIRFIDESSAAIQLRTFHASTSSQWTGRVRMIDGRWLVSRNTVAEMLRDRGIPVPRPLNEG